MAKIRLADIAEEIGVSTVTVHNALTGNKGVSEDVRIRICEAAADRWDIKFHLFQRRIEKRRKILKV